MKLLATILLLIGSAFAQVPLGTSGGGGGAVASVTGSAGVTCTPTTGAVICSLDTSIADTRTNAQANQDNVIADATGSDTYACTLAASGLAIPTLGAGTIGSLWQLIPTTGNTGAATCQGLSIIRADLSALVTGDVLPSVPTFLYQYSATQLLTLSGPGSRPASGSTSFSQNTVSIIDDFFPSATNTGANIFGQYLWQTAGTFSAFYIGGSGYTGHPGNVILNTGASTNNQVTLTLNNQSVSPILSVGPLGTGGDYSAWGYQAIFKTDDNSSTVANTAAAIGFMDTTTYRTGNTITLRYDSSNPSCPAGGTTSGTTWVLEVIKAGAIWCANTTVTVAAATWYRAYIYLSGTTVVAQVSTAGGAYSSAVNVNLSEAPTVIMQPIFLLQTLTGSARRVTVDRFEFAATTTR